LKFSFKNEEDLVFRMLVSSILANTRRNTDVQIFGPKNYEFPSILKALRQLDQINLLGLHTPCSACKIQIGINLVLESKA
jgi:hypothetical protein